jgi:hypothetical protein
MQDNNKTGMTSHAYSAVDPGPLGGLQLDLAPLMQANYISGLFNKKRIRRKLKRFLAMWL